MSRRSWIAAFCAALLAACASAPKGPPPRPWEKGSPSKVAKQVRFKAMGTGFIARIWTGAGEDAPAATILMELAQDIKELDKLVDPERDGSDVFRINEMAGKDWVMVSREVLEMVQLSQQMWKRSGGAFNVTYRPGVAPENMRGLDLEVNAPARAVKLQTVITRLNLFGMARGYAVERAVRKLRAHKVSGFVVGAGGFFAAYGNALQDPRVMCVEDPERLGHCAVPVQTLLPSSVLYLGVSASAERKGNIYNPNDLWKYRRGGVVVAGDSGAWVQFATTIASVMTDSELKALFLPSQSPRLSGSTFAEGRTMSGGLEPFARFSSPSGQ